MIMIIQRQDGLWDIYEVIQQKVGKNYTLTKTIVQVLEKGSTLPFLSRYRKEMSCGMSLEDLRNIKNEHNQLVELRRQAGDLIEKYKKEDKLSDNIREAILAARSVEELECAKESFKASYGENARKLGLHDMATAFIKGEKNVPQLKLTTFVNRAVKGKRSVREIMQGLQYILSEELHKDRVILDKINEISRNSHIIIKSRENRATPENIRVTSRDKKDSKENFLSYMHFKMEVGSISSHQVLAMNRGEALGFLLVSVDVPDRLEDEIKIHCRVHFMKPHMRDAASRALLEDTVRDCMNRLIRPHVHRLVRASLNRRAEKEAMKCFSDNLRSLLLTPPIRGQPILGMDPGFNNGCKLAMISGSGQVLDHDVILLHPDYMLPAKIVLQTLLRKYKCQIIAIGDGVGCRETQALVSECIRQKMFSPLNVKFCTVREAGLSIYSVTQEAEAELPGLDVCIKSAVGIARRLQDPLVEYVKIEPKHLGIGMYQHDINESSLKEALQSTVVECVSFVGVDINVCAEFLLRQVAGLNATTARSIIKYREENGPFRNREQLRVVPQMTPLKFEQCAGFVKIYPETAQICEETQKNLLPTDFLSSFEPLDTTVIHPESYEVARNVIKDIGVDIKDLGRDNFIKQVKRYSVTCGSAGVSRKYEIPVPTAELILKALMQRKSHDIRNENARPIFLESVRNASDIKVGDVLTGVVENVAPFGAFVDCGIGDSILLHNSGMRNIRFKI